MSPTLWVKPCPGPSRSLRRREHRAEEQHEAVGVLVVRADRLGDEVERIAADHRHRARARPARSRPGRRPASRARSGARRRCRSASSNRRMNGPIAHDALLSLALPSSSALRPSKSRRLTSLPSVAPTISPRLFTASTISGSGLFHVRLRVDADLGTGADRRHRLRLGEDLGVRTDADLEILRPRALRAISASLSRAPPASPGARSRGRRRSARDQRPRTASALRRVAARLLLDHALEHARDEGDAGGLDRLQVAGREEATGQRASRVAGRRVREHVGERRRPAAALPPPRIAPTGSSCSRSCARRRRAAPDRSKTSSPSRARAHGPSGRGEPHPPDQHRALARLAGRHAAAVRRVRRDSIVFAGKASLRPIIGRLPQDARVPDSSPARSFRCILSPGAIGRSAGRAADDMPDNPPQRTDVLFPEIDPLRDGPARRRRAAHAVLGDLRQPATACRSCSCTADRAAAACRTIAAISIPAFWRIVALRPARRGTLDARRRS